jgi:hypothetical protein
LKPPKRWHFARASWRGSVCSRTGYTGEDGYEIFARRSAPSRCGTRCAKRAATLALPAWRARHAAHGDGYPLYGHELDRAHDPIEAASRASSRSAAASSARPRCAATSAGDPRRSSSDCARGRQVAPGIRIRRLPATVW